MKVRRSGSPAYGRERACIAAILLTLTAALAAASPPAQSAPGAIGRAPARFTAAQLGDPSFYPERGFYDVKGVTNFGGTPDDTVALATMGIGRLDTSWERFEPVKLSQPCPAGYDTFDGHCFKAPADIDERIERYTSEGLPVMAIVFATPQWARGAKPCDPYNSWSDVFCSPDDPEDFARFARYLATRYDGAHGHGRLTDFVIQNEVNLNQWFNIGCGKGIPCDLDQWTADYATLYGQAYDAIRAVQPHAKVMISLTQHFESALDDPQSTHPLYSIKTFLPRVVSRLGDREWSLALHPYPRSVDPSIDALDLPYATMGNLGVVVGWLRATYPTVPSAWEVELTEQGLNNPGIFDAEQADSLCRAFEGVLGTPGVRSLIYHRLRDVLGEFGLFLGLLSTDGSPKPAYETWLHANDPANPTCGFQNFPNTVIRSGVAHSDGSRWTSSRPLPAGYQMQTTQWLFDYSAQPGSAEVFECGDGDDDASPPTYPSATWLSRAPDCDGATPMGPVGWARTRAAIGLQPIVTCVVPGRVPTTVAGTCAGAATTIPVGYAAVEPVPAEELDAANNPPTTTTTTVPVDPEQPDLSAFDVVFALREGSFKIGSSAVVGLPDGTGPNGSQTYLAGTWDRRSGALALRMIVPRFTAPVQTKLLPDPIPTTFELTQVGQGLGSLDPDSGEMYLHVVINTRLTSPEPLYAGFLGPACMLGPASLDVRTVVPFDLASSGAVALVADEGFEFPAAHGCGSNGDMDTVLNPALELPTTATSAHLELAFLKDGSGSPTTTSTPTSLPDTSTTINGSNSSTSMPRNDAPTRPTALAPAATAARPVAATPTYTG